MFHTNEFYFQSSSGKNRIYAKTWLPEESPRAILQIAHGISEHIGRYDAFAGFLAEHGFVVFGNDHLGHGKSADGEENLGYFSDSDGWVHVTNDMRKLTNRMRRRYPALPCFLFGHSMGSFMARTYLIRWRTGLRGVILSGTGSFPPQFLMLGRRIARQEIRKHGGRYRSPRLMQLTCTSRNRTVMLHGAMIDMISSDKAAVDEYRNDPLTGFLPTAGLFSEMLDGIRFNQSPRNLMKMNRQLPILLLSGARDPIGGFGRGVNRTANAFRRAGCTDVTVRLYPKGRHEMLHESNREQVYADILDWLEDRLRE